MVNAQGLFILFILPLVEHSLYLYNTEDSSSTEFYDCIYANDLSYCRRPLHPASLSRDQLEMQCANNATSHTFSTLMKGKANVAVILHEWKSSVEKLEEYLRYNKTAPSSGGSESFLCECTHPQSFGKHCEYLLPTGTTLEDTLTWQVEMRRNDSW